MTDETDPPIIPITEPVQTFEDHENTDNVLALAVFPDGRHMVTGSVDGILRLWDLKDPNVLKKMKGHRVRARAVAISQDRQMIASAHYREVIARDRGTGQVLTPAIKAHSTHIRSLDFSPDGTILATGSSDRTTKLWDTKTWQLQNSIDCDAEVYSVRYSPSGEMLAIATASDIQIWNTGTRECIAIFKDRVHEFYIGSNLPLGWMPDGMRLLSGGCRLDPTIRQWEISTRQQAGDPWRGHYHDINAIAINSNGTLVASASTDHDVRLWRLWDRKTIAIFRHSSLVRCVAFSADGKRILSGGDDKKISEWMVPEHALCDVKILTVNACINRDLSTAEELLTREIDSDANNYNSYANRSIVRARKNDWDRALHDAAKSLSIQPSLMGYISKGIALCGKKQLWDAIRAFDLASMFTNEDLKANRHLLLIKAVALFNADQHNEAILRVQELAELHETCPGVDTNACSIVKAYLHLQLGKYALNDARHDKAADQFAAAVNASGFSSKLGIHSEYEDFVSLFGWNLKSLWQTANQERCLALLQTNRVEEALEAHRHMIEKSDESTKASCLDWSTAFKKQCSDRYIDNGNAAFRAKYYGQAIALYSAAIDLAAVSYAIFAKRSEARLEEMLWEDALLDARKVIELNPSSYIGYELKHAALLGSQNFYEAVDAFQTMLFKLGTASDPEIRKSRQQYLDRLEAEIAIRKVFDAQFENAPYRLLNTTTGLLCDRDAQINTFNASPEYIELLLFTMKHPDLRTERINEVVEKYFRYVMLSHRWDLEGKEPTLRDIQDRDVYSLDPLGSVVKLQKFCKVVHDIGYHWAWMDTCCIDQYNNLELQESLNSMFVWYRHSALTIVYLSDVPPASESGALANSEWNRRGWTVQEFLAPRVILFYQKDWTLYLDDRSSNHKKSNAIMQELQDATGIDSRFLVDFHPDRRGARDKLKWASTRTTKRQEDIAYSLFGIFGVRLRVDYGEKKQYALGRLLQEIVAESGDITCLDWIGEPSEFNSCLPADIASYENPAYEPPSLSEDEIQTSISSLRNAVAVDSALKLYTLLKEQPLPSFAHRRLRLPCMIFRVTEVRRSLAQDEQPYFTYEVKANGLHDLSLKTKKKLGQFSLARPGIQRAVLLVRPWNRRLLEFPALADETQSVQIEDAVVPHSISQNLPHELPGEKGTDDLYLHSQALRLIVRLGQHFNALLLIEQHSGEYKRIASDLDIIAQVKDRASVHNMIDVKILEIS